MSPSSPSPSPISKLPRELLLKIFACAAQDAAGNATLAAAARCCRLWYPVVQMALYTDVSLRDTSIAKFAACSEFADDQNPIRSLTLRMGPIPVNPYDPSEAQRVEQARVDAVRQIGPRLLRMRQLTSFSIRADFLTALAAQESVFRLVDSLPPTCTGLEIDIAGRPSGDGIFHICPRLRDCLPRLRHLRLRLPRMCSALWQTPKQDGSHDSAGEEGFMPVHAPHLEHVIVNISLREPGPYSCGYQSTLCDGGGHVLDANSPRTTKGMRAALEAFCARNPSITRFCVIDSQDKPKDPPNTWAAWIRRDFKSQTSRAIPLGRIGGFRPDAHLARLPRADGAPGSEDLLSSPEVLEGLAEGGAWVETPAGVRLPGPVMRARGYETLAPALSRAEFSAGNNITCNLWRNEEETGQKLLPEHSLPLMQSWHLQERTPSGWRRDAHEGAPMVKQRLGGGR